MFHWTIDGIFPDRHHSHLTQTAKNREYRLITVLKIAILPIYHQGTLPKKGIYFKCSKISIGKSAYPNILYGGLRSWTKVEKQNNNLSSLNATYPTQCQENTFTIRGTNTCNKKL